MKGLLIVVTKELNIWNIINIKGPMTCQEFDDHCKKEYNIKIFLISNLLLKFIYAAKLKNYHLNRMKIQIVHKKGKIAYVLKFHAQLITIV